MHCNDSKVSNAQSLSSQTPNWNFIPHVPLTVSRVILGTDLSSLRMLADGEGCLMCQLLGYTGSLCVKLTVCVVFLLHNIALLSSEETPGLPTPLNCPQGAQPMRQTTVTESLTAWTVRTQEPKKACECLGQLFGEMVLF